MEMGGESVWKATEEEEAAAAEELGGGGLEIRQRKKGKMGRESEEKVVNGEENSVYLEADKGVWKCRHCTWTYHLSGPGRDVIQKHEGSCQVVMDVKTLTQLGTYIDSPFKGADVNNGTFELKIGEADEFVSEKNPQNGISDNGAKEFNNHKNVPVEEQNHNLRNAVTGNGSHCHLISEKTSSNGSSRIENEIQEYKQIMPGESSKSIVEEFDVERVLEEQETHDLYCPNCHSCITKRVILRKRKRTLQENPSDLPPQKVPHVPEASHIPTETSEHEDRTVFRCLSCFSFFIPTECGFNILWIFGKRDGSANLQSSDKKPVRNGNWVSSSFRSGSSKKEGTEAGVPLLAESNTISSGDPSWGTKEYYPTIPTQRTAHLGEKGAISGMNSAGVALFAESNMVSSGDPSSKTKEYCPPILTPRTAHLGEKGAISEMNSAGVSLFAESNTVSSGDPSSETKEYCLPIPTPRTAHLGENVAISGMNSPGMNSAVSNGDPSSGTKEYCPSIPTQRTAHLGEKGAISGMNSAISSEDPSSGMREYCQPIPIPRTAHLEEKGAISGMNSAGVPSLAESNTVSRGDPSKGSKEFPPPIHSPGTTDLGEIGAICGMINKGPPAGESYSNSELMGNQTQGNKPDYPTPTLSEGNGSDKPGVTVKPPILEGNSQTNKNIYSFMPLTVGYVPPGENTSKPVSMIKPTSPVGTTQGNQNIHGSDTPAVETRINVGEPRIEESGRDNDWDVLKSIVYGGLLESITSLGVVSSAAGTGSSTLNICALGLANLIGGLCVIAHDLSELKSAHDAEATNQREERAGRYWEKLGKREHFRRHVVFSILSYIIFGLLPPVIYGFAFRESDNKEYKLIAVAASSLLCVSLLAIGKAHVRPQKYYIKSLFYYLGIALSASGLSYVAGVMIDRLLVELGVFIPSTPSSSPPASIELFRLGSGASAYASL